MNLFDMLLTVLVTCVSGIEIAHIVLESILGQHEGQLRAYERSKIDMLP